MPILLNSIPNKIMEGIFSLSLILYQGKQTEIEKRVFKEESEGANCKVRGEGAESKQTGSPVTSCCPRPAET